MIFIWNLQEENALSKQEQADFHALVLACQKKEKLTLQFPEDASFVFGFFGERRLLGLLAVCESEPGTGECYAFTHPDYRGQGIFTDLMDAALDFCDQLEAETGKTLELVLVSDEKSRDAALVREHLALPLWYSEYQMELMTPPSPGLEQNCSISSDRQQSAAPVPASAPASVLPSGSPGSLTGSPFTEEDGTEALCYADQKASCRLLPCGEHSYYLYHMEVEEGFRGCGLGTAFLHALLGQLPAGTKLRLQVSSDNLPALALYKKAGFRITETLSFYEY